jgi:putative ABC transport system permease protein
MTPARDPAALRLCLAIVRLGSRIVPAAQRDAWTREWEAELRHRWSRRAGMSRAGELTMVRRTFGSLVDAAWIRRQFTLDADAVHDFVHGVRMLLKAPGFTAITLLVLATGIGAATAIASLADALLLRRLPLPDADRIVTLWERNTTTGIGGGDVAPGNAIDWLARTRSFSAIAAIAPWSLDYAPEGGEPEVLYGAAVTPAFFDVLGVPMLHGRAFTPSEFTKGNDGVAILSHPVFQRRFAGDPSVVGRTIRLDAQPVTIVGVMRPGIDLRLFEGRREPWLYLPKIFEEYEPRIRGSGYWNVIARLKPDATLASARQELDVLSAQLAADYPNSNRNIEAEAVPLRDHLAGSLRELLPLLIGASALLLLVACANAANLLLARGVARAREFAVRQALGAGRGRLIRQMLLESLMFAAAGGALGLAFAVWALRAIASLRPLDVSGADRIALDYRVMALAIAVSAIAAAVAGVVPALQLSRPRAAAVLREGASTSRARRVPNALVVVEVSLALLLAIGAGLLVRSLQQIQRVDPGFARARIFSLQVFAWDRNDSPAKLGVFFTSALDGLRSQPGVASVGAVSAMPFAEANINIRSAIAIDGRAPSVPGDDSLIYTTIVAGDYFETMRIPLERGRFVGGTDRAGGRLVAAVSRSAARKFWPGGNPVGSKVTIRFSGKPLDAEIVGVVGDARHETLDRPARPELFLPHAQVPFGSMTFVVRAAPGAAVALTDLKRRIWAIDPQQAFYDTSTTEALVSRTLVGRRFSVFLAAAFGIAALILAAAGLYGVLSFSTGQRTREFGVRLALGARPRDIVIMVVREGLQLAVAGIVVGVIAAAWITRLLSGLLFGVTPTDAVTYAVVIAAILAVSIVSCCVPARRALRSDPLVAVRST